jgi:peptidoglycan/LPS O-acetylase OafA/YrhL
MYLFHMLLLIDEKQLYKYINHVLPPSVMHYQIYITFVENFIIQIVISWLSWQSLEQPTLKLKNYFDYQTSKAPVTVAVE